MQAILEFQHSGWTHASLGYLMRHPTHPQGKNKKSGPWRHQRGFSMHTECAQVSLCGLRSLSPETFEPGIAVLSSHTQRRSLKLRVVGHSLKVTQQKSTEAGFTLSQSRQTDLVPVRGLFKLDSSEPFCLCPSLFTEGLCVSAV